MLPKKQVSDKIVHRFTDNAHMRFRPTNYQLHQPKVQNRSFTSTVSNILGGLFKPKVPQSSSREGNNRNLNKSASSRGLGKNKSSILSKASPNESLIDNSHSQSSIHNNSLSRNSSVLEVGNISRDNSVSNILEQLEEGDNTLCFFEKINTETYLIGNQYQLDLITIIGVFDNKIDTDLNWSLSPSKLIKKLAVDTKKMFIAIETIGEVQVFKYNTKRIKTPPALINKIRLVEKPQFLMFLKDSIFGVFYATYLVIHAIDDSSSIRQLFHKPYGVPTSFILMQVPRPSDYILNIFFREPSEKARINTLWRLELDLRNITSHQNFKAVMRVYDIPNHLLKDLKISNFARDIFIMNFKFELLAAKDGYIMDSANINYEKEESFLVHNGESIILITDIKMEIYSFKIATNVKPNKIIIASQDSIEIAKQQAYRFVNCIQMYNGNFLLLYEIKPQFNKKAKGQIDYMITLTQKLTVSQKLSEIFDFKSPEHLRLMAADNYSQIENKCDIAFKIGLSRKDIFLELWNKSGKNEVDDYKFLLDTLDYQVIKLEIQKKLKKCSMLFRQVYKLQQCCLEMLQKDVFGSKCSYQTLKYYLNSHFLLRKLQFYRDRQIISEHYRSQQDDENRRLTIDIQQYFTFANLELKSYFLERAFKLCFEDKDLSDQIRLFLRSFRFPLRVIYTSLLEQLVVQSKHKLIKFLKAIPQILPYSHSELPDGHDTSLFQGLHTPIRPEEWGKNLYWDGVVTIYNREILQELTKSVWFKRYQYSVHDLIPLSEQKIKEMQKYNASDNIFYFFIQKVFQHCTHQQELEEVILFLESNYDQLPQHLKGRIFLYRNLFNYFMEEQCHGYSKKDFSKFLRKQDFELLHQLFKHEKVKKGCLLKDAKAIYRQMADGSAIFNESLLHYFMSDMSEISDLKCILNRLNNEKRQFHIQNEGIYEVLVKGMQTKLKLGSDNDIPLDQVMIYVENIPLTKNNPIIEELQTIQKINQESERFKSIKINMSFLEIMEKEEYVITALLEEQIRKKNIMQMEDEEQFIGVTYQILAEIQIVKQKIYKDKFRNLQYFLYLNKLLEHQKMIRFAKRVLNDTFLAQQYTVDQIIIQNLILFMYKWRLEQKNYIDHQDYVYELVTILPKQNSIRKYVQAETAFAVMLSSPQHPVQYPLAISEEDTSSLSTIRLSEIENLFGRLNVDFILDLNLQRMHSYVKEMEIFYEEEIIKLEDIYEIAIKRLLKLKAVCKAIPIIRKLINLRSDQEHYCAVFCFLILNIIIKDISTQAHKRYLAKIAFFTYQHPLDFLEIMEKRLNSTFSNQEEQIFLRKELERVSGNKCYNPENILLDRDILEKVKENENKYVKAFEDAIFHSWDQVTNSRDDFVQFEYACVFIILLHNPYALSKYLTVNSQNLNLRIVRSYLSYMFKEQIFNKMNVLLFGKRAFTIALENRVTQLQIQYITSQYKGVELDDEQEFLLEEMPTDQFDLKLVKSITAFTRKLEVYKTKPDRVQNPTLKKKRIEDLLNRSGSAFFQKSEYPFNDSDDNYESAEEEQIVKPAVKNKKKGDKKPLRQEKNLALFLSSCGEESQVMRKTSPKMLKTSLTFHNQFQSLHFSRDKKLKNRKGSDNNLGNTHHLGIKHTDSIAAVGQDYEQHSQDLVMSSGNFMKVAKHPKLQKSSNIEEDLMYVSIEEKRYNKSLNLRSPNMEWSGTRSYSPSQSAKSEEHIRDSGEELPSPTKPKSKQSLVDIDDGEEGQLNQQVSVVNSIEIPSMEIPLVFKVTVNQINDEDYTSPHAIIKQILEDIDTNEKQPIFNIALLQNQKNKDFGDFEAYLKKVVFQIYDNSGYPLSLLLSLIEEIHKNYPELQIQSNFLKIYIALENYNTKYRYNLPIRDMFPIEAIFLESSDIKALFQYIKNNVLNYVDFDNIMVVAKVVHFSFQKSDIKDQLYYSYLSHAIPQYGNNERESQEELFMQKQRIGGIIEQIILLNMFIERGPALLESLSDKIKRRQIADMIKEAMRKKKKDNLIGQFEAAINHLI